jgi:hypothetical protein
MVKDNVSFNLAIVFDRGESSIVSCILAFVFDINKEMCLNSMDMFLDKGTNVKI